MAKTVRAPDGTTWRIGRKWTPWRLRWRGRKPEVPDLGDLPGPDFIDTADEPTGCLVSLGIWIGLVLALVFGFFFVFPVVVLAVEVVFVLLLVGGVAFANVVLRRPWIVMAEHGGVVSRTWKRVGWRASGRLVEDAAAAIERGQPLPF